MIVDTSALLAFFNANDRSNPSMTKLFESATEPLIVSPYVVAELDYLIATRFGVDAEIAALRELSSGAWVVADLATADLARATDAVERYADQQVGVTDASIVVLADRYRTRRIATLDRRHFEVLRPLTGGRFIIVS